jgi:hypothetical protein
VSTKEKMNRKKTLPNKNSRENVFTKEKYEWKIVFTEEKNYKKMCSPNELS